MMNAKAGAGAPGAVGEQRPMANQPPDSRGKTLGPAGDGAPRRGPKPDETVGPNDDDSLGGSFLLGERANADDSLGGSFVLSDVAISDATLFVAPGPTGLEPTIAQSIDRQHPDDPSGLAETIAQTVGPGPSPEELTVAFESAPAAPVRKPAEPLKGPKVEGYEVLGELGRGGMGVVYKARQTGLNRLVALKMVIAGEHAGAEELERFRTEGEAVAALQHTNIVQIFEVGERDGLPYFSLEFVDGGSLAQLIDGKPLQPRRAAEILEPLARAMAFAHQRGIIHRDLKPANILLTAGGTPKVTDFGLAKKLEGDSSQTRSGTLMGTPSYMAPEQARGDTHAIGPLSDVYALGAILYELLTGRPPFQGATLLDTLDQVRSQEPVPPTRLLPRISRDVETVCLKCLQKEPHKRYADASALAEDLRRFLDGSPILARPVGPAERTWRWCRRNPRVAALNGAVGVLAVSLGVGLALSYARGVREQQILGETRRVAEGRIRLASETVAGGDDRRALDLLTGSDPLVRNAPALADVKEQTRRLRAQIDVYGRFKRGLDALRFATIIGRNQDLPAARKMAHELVALYDRIEAKAGEARDGLPPLSDRQTMLFKEDVFDMVVVAASVESNFASLSTDTKARGEGFRRCVGWFDRVESLLPPTKTFYNRRRAYRERLGDLKGAKADSQRAGRIEPTAPVDRFWHGNAEHGRARAAHKTGDAANYAEHLRLARTEFTAVIEARPENFWAYYEWASCALKLNDPDAAVIGYTACNQLRPDVPWPYNSRAEAHMLLKNDAEAVRDCDAAVALDPNYANAYYRRARARLRLGQEDLALADFRRAVDIEPGRTAFRLALARTLIELGRPEAALDDLGRVIEAFAGAPVSASEDDTADDEPAPDLLAALLDRELAYRALKKDDLARTDLERARALAKQDDVDDRYKLALTYEADRRNAFAASLLDQVLRLTPRNANARLKRAAIRQALHDLPGARDDYSALILVVPNKPIPLKGRAFVNLFAKDFDTSLADWAEIARLAPRVAEPRYYTGVIKMGRRQYGDALKSFDQALAVDPKYSLAYLARARIRYWRGEPEAALADINRVVDDLEPKNAYYLNDRPDVLVALSRLDEARADCERSIALKPNQVDAYLSLARICLKENEPAEARECCDRMVLANRSSPDALLRRAEFLRDLGDRDAASADCDRAEGLGADPVLLGLTRAGLLASGGAHAGAAAEAERLLRLDHYPPHDGHALYAAACVFSLASRAAESGGDPARASALADRATALLGEALDKGYHDLNYQEHERMNSDPALEPIRSRPGVRALLARRGD